MRIIFAGTPEFALPTLQALCDSEHKIVAVYTQPDRPSGRGLKLTPSIIKIFAEQKQIPVEQPVSLKVPEAQTILKNYQADMMIVVAYGLILPEAVLTIPRFGCLNIHGSILPKWRGAAPIQRALLAGEIETGITIMQMDKGLDTGNMLLKNRLRIENSDTSKTLHDKLSILGASSILQTLNLLQKNQLTPEIQDETQATYAHKLTKEEAKINWNNGAKTICLNIRGYHPWPVAHTQLNNKTVRIWFAEPKIDSSSHTVGTIIKTDKLGILVKAVDSAVNITQLQFPGGKILSANDAVNSRLIHVGEIFS